MGRVFNNAVAESRCKRWYDFRAGDSLSYLVGGKDSGFTVRPPFFSIYILYIYRFSCFISCIDTVSSFFPHRFPSLCFPFPSLACRASLAFLALRFVIFFLVFHVSALHRRCCPSFYSSSFFVSLCRTARSDLSASRLCHVSPSFVYYVDIVFRSMHYRPMSFPYAIRFPHSTVSPLVLPVDDPFGIQCVYRCIRIPGPRGHLISSPGTLKT